MTDYIFEVMRNFEKSYVNGNEELILIPETNLYVNLKNINTPTDLRFKLLEECSRDCCYAEPFESDIRNELYNEYVLESLNNCLGTQFTKDEIEIIYKKLGNGIRHELTMHFVYSGYDMKLLGEK